MKKIALWVGMLLMISPLVFSQANSGDYILITVESGGSIDTVVQKYLKSSKLKSDLLRYNNMSASSVKPGTQLKIPYGISKERAAKIKFFKGKVERQSENGDWKAVRRVGEVLLQHDKLKTDKNAKVEIQFDDGSLMQMYGDSIISLQEYSYSKTKGRSANVKLDNGSLFANVNRLRKASGFQVTTVTAVAGVRGTQFYVALDEKKEMKVEVYKGEVEVASDNKKVSVKSGNETKVEQGGDPEAPKKITNPRKIKWAR